MCFYTERPLERVRRERVDWYDKKRVSYFSKVVLVCFLTNCCFFYGIPGWCLSLQNASSRLNPNNAFSRATNALFHHVNISFFSQPRYGRLARTPAAISRSESESESVRERTEDPDAKRMVGGCGFSDDAAAGSSQAGDVLQGRGVD